MKVLDTWVHEYDLEYSYFLKPYIPQIIDRYNQQKEKGDNRFDWDFTIESALNFLYPKLNKIVEDNFYVGKRFGNLPMRVYIQPPNAPKETHSFFHNHAHLPGSLCGVFYLNIPKEGGEFQAINPPHMEIKFKPKINKVYLFPVWLTHRALPHIGDETRICFNWVYAGSKRPIFKLGGLIW